MKCVYLASETGGDGVVVGDVGSYLPGEEETSSCLNNRSDRQWRVSVAIVVSEGWWIE